MTEKTNSLQMVSVLEDIVTTGGLSQTVNFPRQILSIGNGVLRHDRWVLEDAAFLEVIHFKSRSDLSRFFSEEQFLGMVYKILEVVDDDGSVRVYQLRVAA